MGTPSKTVSRAKIAEELYRKFLAFQRRRGIRTRVIAKEGLTLLAARILGYLELAPGMTAADLSRIWNAERSVISRTLAKLQRRKLLSSTIANDARRRKLLLTDSGIRLVRDLDSKLALITNESILSLNSEERNELSGYINCLADAISKKSALDSSIIQRPSEHPINFALMRISMCGGMYGGKFFGTALTIQQAQLLDITAQHEEGIDIATLSRETCTEQSTVSRATAQLVRSGLLEKTASTHDRRMSLVYQCSKGTSQLSEHCREVGKHFEDALCDLSTEDLKSFCTLLGRVAITSPVQGSTLLQQRIEVRECETDRERAVARGFLTAEAVRRRMHFQLPETLVPKSGLAFGLFIDQHLQGVCDCVQQGSRWIAQNFLIASEIESSELRLKFEKACRERFAERYIGRNLSFEQ